MILLLLLLAPSATATGVGASPHELFIEVEEGKEAHTTLTIYNLEHDPLFLNAASTSRTVQTQSTTVEKTTTLPITVDARDLQPGTYHETLYLSSNDEDLALGLSIPLIITVAKSTTRNLWLPFIIGFSAYLFIMEGLRRILQRYLSNTFK